MNAMTDDYEHTNPKVDEQDPDQKEEIKIEEEIKVVPDESPLEPE